MVTAMPKVTAKAKRRALPASFQFARKKRTAAAGKRRRAEGRLRSKQNVGDFPGAQSPLPNMALLFDERPGAGLGILFPGLARFALLLVDKLLSIAIDPRVQLRRRFLELIVVQ